MVLCRSTWRYFASLHRPCANLELHSQNFDRVSAYSVKNRVPLYPKNNIVAMPGVAPGSMFNFAPASVGAFLLEILSGERLLRITTKNARNPCEIGCFRVQIMYVLCKTLIIKVYCGERGSQTFGIIEFHEMPNRLFSAYQANLLVS